MSYHRHNLLIGWAPERLANSDRPMLSWWDASKPLTIATGVSNQPDRGVNGLDFAQATAGEQAVFSGAGSTSLITYDGTNDNLEQPVTSGDWQDLTYHEYWCAVFVDQTNAVFNFSFGIEGGGNQDRWLCQIVSTGKAIIFQQDDSPTADRVDTDDALSVGWHIVGYVSTGSEYKIYVDNNLADISVIGAGSNSGKFVGDLTNKADIDLVTIANLEYVPLHSANLEKFGLSLGGASTDAATTAAERTEIFNYINAKFQLGI